VKLTLENARTQLHDLRRQLAQLEERAASQNKRLEILQSHSRAAQQAHAEALAAKAATLAQFGAGVVNQGQVDAARKTVDDMAARMAASAELLHAVESDLQSVTRDIQQLEMTLGPATTRAWRAVFEYLVGTRPPEVDSYLAQLHAAAVAANGVGDFGAILSAVRDAYDFTAAEKRTRELLSKEFLSA
jgi:seryl-tRNA synthetase